MSDNVSEVKDKILPSTVRPWIYLCFGVAGLILIIVGVSTQDQVSEWLMFAGTILGIGGNGMATANWPKKKEVE